MNTENILDEQLSIEQKDIKEWRPLAILLESIPFTIIFIGFGIGNLQMIVYGVFGLVFLYLFGGWYIFKADKYRAKDIIMVVLAAFLGLMPSITGLLYKQMSWPGANEMLFIGMNTFLFLTVVLLVWYLFHRKRMLEYRLSLKLLSRLLLFALLAYLFM